MKAKEIRELTPSELQKQLDDSRRELLSLRIQTSNGQLENTARIPQVRKDIARLLGETKGRQLKEVAE